MSFKVLIHSHYSGSYGSAVHSLVVEADDYDEAVEIAKQAKAVDGGSWMTVKAVVLNPTTGRKTQ